MARLAYADIGREEVRALAARIAAERGEVLHIYRMLLHSPVVAEGWLALMTAIRQRAALAGDLRELVIMRIAQLNGANYEAEQHRAYALREGVSEAQLDALAAWERSDLFSPIQRAVLAYTDAMTRDVKVPEDIFAQTSEHFDECCMIELTATVASYNMVSRFLVALEVEGSDKV
ncbi:MAG: carboxymuconolactone decarboxylase family protein [Xanthobacteraceae bacterium]|nr:carboxymuconolactone decarboxylase family protein [Xanthobacteraceae bacterium]